MDSGSVGEVEADRRGVAQVDGGRLEGEELALVVATLVLELGENVYAVHQASDTALHAAGAKGYRSVVQALPDRGAQIEVRNKRGQTPLALTAQPPPPGLVVYQPDLEGMGHLLRTFGGTGEGVGAAPSPDTAPRRLVLTLAFMRVDSVHVAIGLVPTRLKSASALAH